MLKPSVVPINRIKRSRQDVLNKAARRALDFGRRAVPKWLKQQAAQQVAATPNGASTRMIHSTTIKLCFLGVLHCRLSPSEGRAAAP
jgi:hypothetical protein